MADGMRKTSDSETKAEAEETVPLTPEKVNDGAGGGGGWGGWGFSPLSYISDLQRAAAVAAEEISRNAVEAAKMAAKSISDGVADDLESPNEASKEDEPEVGQESDDEDEKKRKTTLDKLEKASEESILSQGLKVLDDSVESFASGAWQALGTALKGGATLVHKIENSASNLAESIQQGGIPGSTGSVAPSLLEAGRAFTTKGMLVLEQVGKETMDLLISETGIQLDRRSDEQADEHQLYDDITFDRCFYIYGGPETLEELEALSNHYALLYNRRKAKLSSEQKYIYDGKLKEVQQIFDLSAQYDVNITESEKGKKVESSTDESMDELIKLHDSSVRKAAELAAGFASSLSGLTANDVIQRTSGRLVALHSEGVHKLSEISCFGVTQLLVLGKSIISHANRTPSQEMEEIDWPEDSVERAKIIRGKVHSVTGKIEAIVNSFITGISDVAEAYIAAIKYVADDQIPEKSVQQKANAFNEHLRADHKAAAEKLKDGLQYLTYVVVSTSMPSSA